MKNTGVLISLVCLLTAVNFTSANTIRGINIDFVPIGHADNAADFYGYGAVSYNYRIGTYEVTNAQWNAFIAAAGAPTGTNGSYGQSATYIGDQQPTNYVSWYETLQFCNYLTSGDKSKGAYQFSGDNASPGSFIGINRAAAQAIYGTIYVLPTENEWHKAAYFKPDGSGYSLYANGTNIAPIAGVQSNYNMVIGTGWDVGTGTQEQNGTFDMMGNVWEWNELILSNNYRGLRGGCAQATNGSTTFEESSYYFAKGTDETYAWGFRIAEIPEPATLLLLGLGGLVLRKRK